jgi:hypothetical protein
MNKKTNDFSVTKSRLLNKEAKGRGPNKEGVTHSMVLLGRLPQLLNVRAAIFGKREMRK